MPRTKVGEEKPTHPIIWCAAIICAFLAILVIISGVVIFVGYLFYHPKIPSVQIVYAQLDDFSYDQAGVLNTRLAITLRAESDNSHATASFSAFHYELIFNGLTVARLVNNPFNVGKNSSVDFNYQVQSNYIPLDPDHMAMVQRSLRLNRAEFELSGHTRSRWRVGPFKSVRFLINLDCFLQFRIFDDSGGNRGEIVYTHCNSRSK